MKKNSAKISIYMILFSFIAKILSFLARIILARNISTTAMGYYSILSPTIIILITCVQMGIPSIISKIVAKKGYTFKDVSTSIYFTIFTTLITSSIYLLLVPTLSHLLYKQNFTSLLYSVVPFLPCVSISGLLKGYLLGRRKFMHSSFSNVVEETSRIMFLLIVFSCTSINDPIQMCKIAIYAMILGEICSIAYMLYMIYLEKHRLIKKLEYSNDTLKYILKESLFISGARFIGSLTCFLEPILLHLVTSNIIYEKMVLVYGYINGYVLPLLTMPSFLTIALSTYLLPSFSYEYSRNNIKKANTMYFSILYFCLVLNVIYCLTLYTFSEQICMLFYNNIEMASYLKQMSIPFMMYALQPILNSCMHAFGYNTFATIDTTIGCIIRLLTIFFLTPYLQENTLSFAICIGMIVTTTLHVLHISFKKKRYI